MFGSKTMVTIATMTSLVLVACGEDGPVVVGADVESPSWIKISGPLGQTTPSNITTISAGSGGNVFVGTGGGLVFRSADFGDSWTISNTGLKPEGVQAIAFDVDGRVFAATADGLFRSTDEGGSWAYAGLLGFNVWGLAVSAEGTLFATGPFSGVLRSENGGEVWEGAGNDLISSVSALAIDETGIIFAAVSSQGVYRSFDNGDNWEPANSGLNSSIVYDFAVDSKGNVFAGTGDGVFRSIDKGDNWEAANAGITGLPITNIVVGAADRIIAGARPSFLEPKGIFRSEDSGDSWEAVNNGLTTLSVSSLAASESGVLFSGTRDGVFASSDNGEQWRQSNRGLVDSQVSCLLLSQASTMLAGNDRDGIYRSLDGGVTWEQSNNGLTRPYVQSVVEDDAGNIYVGATGVFLSTDDGVTWTDLGLPFAGVRQVAVAPGGAVFAIAWIYDDFGLLWGSELYRKADQGANWLRLLGRFIIGAIAFRQEDGCMYVGTDVDVLFSLDAGETFEPLPRPTFDRIMHLGVGGGYLYAAAQQSGVFRLSIENGTWETVGLTNHTVSTLDLDHRGHVWVGTTGDGIFRSANRGHDWSRMVIGMRNWDVGAILSAPSVGTFAATREGIFKLAQ